MLSVVFGRLRGPCWCLEAAIRRVKAPEEQWDDNKRKDPSGLGLLPDELASGLAEEFEVAS